MLAASFTGIISAFLPWACISVAGASKGINGFQGYGILVLAVFVSIAFIISLKTIFKKNFLLVIRTMALAALLFPVMEIATFSEIVITQMVFVRVTLQPGIWIAMGSAITIILFATFGKQPQNKLKEPRKVFRRSISIPATSIPGKKTTKPFFAKANRTIGPGKFKNLNNNEHLN
jgi:hypothetical protein